MPEQPPGWRAAPSPEEKQDRQANAPQFESQDARRQFVASVIAAHEAVIRDLLKWHGLREQISGNEAVEKALAVSNLWRETLVRLVGISDTEYDDVLNPTRRSS